MAWLTYLADHGTLANPKRWKKVTKIIWQLRTDDVRLLCSWGKAELVVCEVVTKTTKRLKKGEFANAERIAGEDIGDR